MEIKITPYIETVIEENPSLHILAFNNDQLLAVDKADNKAYYFYEVSEDLAFQFNMLCEVGARYQKWFEESAKLLKYEFGTGETEIDYYDTLFVKPSYNA